MNTRLTVADVRALLSYLVNPSDANDPRFLALLNEVCEKYMYSGKWKGMLVYVAFASADRFITLPDIYFGVCCMRYDRIPMPVFTQFHTFQEGGPGEMVETENFPYMLTDLGDGYPTKFDITAGSSGTLRLKIANVADAAKVFRFFGDYEGQAPPEIMSSTGQKGINLTSVFPSVNTAQPFSLVSAIQAPSNLVGAWSLYWMDGATETLLGEYSPWETRPTYRRYQTGEADKAITTICQRRFVRMRDETDWVIPGNISALRCGLQAMLCDEGFDSDKGANFFNLGLQYLNNEAKASRAGAQAPMALSPWGFGLGGLASTN